MIDFNKNSVVSTNHITSKCTVKKKTSKIKLTKDNKKFLRLIGLLK